MPDSTPRLGLPWLMPAQAGKHVTVNEALGRLDALVCASVVSRTTAAEPSSPEEGDAHILPADAVGGHWGDFFEHDLAVFQDGAWMRIAPRAGLMAHVADEADIVVWTGGAWTRVFSLIDRLENLSALGVGTAPDAANPFAAKLNSALWTARAVGEGGTGDLRYTLNKDAAGNVVSLLFQSGWSGRAELGLVGGEDFTVSVSADGAAFVPALCVDHETGYVALSGLVNPQAALHVSGSVRADKDGPDPGLIVNRSNGGKAAAVGAGIGASYLLFDDSGEFTIAAQSNANVVAGAAALKRDLLTLDGVDGHVAIGARIGAARLHVQDGGAILAETPALAHTAQHVLEEELTALSGASLDTAIACPAGALLLAASVRVTGAITGASGFDLGVPGDPARFATGLGVSAGTSHAAPTAPQPAYAATPVRLTATGGDFTGGAVRVAIHYMSFEAPQS